MDARPSPPAGERRESTETAGAYRVTLWEQPASADADPSIPVAWHEMAFDLFDAEDVREAIRWAEAALASGKGPVSGEGVHVRDREYVIFAKVPGGERDRWLQLAGWNPTRASGPPSNLRRLSGEA